MFNVPIEPEIKNSGITFDCLACFKMHNDLGQELGTLQYLCAPHLFLLYGRDMSILVFLVGGLPVFFLLFGDSARQQL